MTGLADRDLRQRQLVPPEELVQWHPVVIGVGAIGRQVALQLAALGVRQLTLYDHDLVEPLNLAAQGYWPEDLDRSKVECTAQLCRRIAPELRITAIPERFRRSTKVQVESAESVAVFFCVDSIATRKLFWHSVRSWTRLIIDGRMNAEVLRVVCCLDPSVDRSYEKTLFESAEAVTGPCTARSTIYCASIAAGLMVGQFVRQLRGVPVIGDQTLNLLAGELFAA